MAFVRVEPHEIHGIPAVNSRLGEGAPPGREFRIVEYDDGS